MLKKICGGLPIPLRSIKHHVLAYFQILWLLATRYSYQFGVNPKVVSTLVAAVAKRCDVEFVTAIHLLHVCSNKVACGVAICGATTGSFLARLVFPIFEPRTFAC